MNELSQIAFSFYISDPEDILSLIEDELAQIVALRTGQECDEVLDTSPEGQRWLLACSRADYRRGVEG